MAMLAKDLNKKKLLPIEFEPDYSEGAWIESKSNAAATLWLSRFNVQNPGHVNVLYGPKGSGKTHFAKIFKEKSQAVELTPDNAHTLPLEFFEKNRDKKAFLIDNCDLFPERWLLPFFNEASRLAVHVLLTIRQDLAQWHFQLKDLDSRIHAANLMNLAFPDDDLIRKLIQKKCRDEGALIADSVVDYIMQRIPRDFSSILYWIQRINEISLIQGREMTKPLVRDILLDAQDETA